MASAVARANNRGLGKEPPAGSRSRSEVRGRSSLKLKHFWFLDVRWMPQICPFF